MIITRTPFRLSFFGGGTDYPAWYRAHGGAVLATTIDKYCYISCRELPPFFEHRIRIVYSKIENCSSIDDIVHPAARAVLRYLDVRRGIEIHHDGDLPARSGMGSSSAFTVGLLNAIHALYGRMVSGETLTEQSIHVEQELLKETVGSQDQVCASHGGFNHVAFSTTGAITVRPVILPRDRLEELSSSLMLFYTGIKRTAATVADTYVPNLEAKKRELRVIRDMVDESLQILCGSGDLSEFGRLMHESCHPIRLMRCMPQHNRPARSVARLPAPAVGDSCCCSCPLADGRRCGRSSTTCCMFPSLSSPPGAE
jgi:D-glycero-alpha-D-manno-heptose-7-phosphate kinase